MFWSTNYKVLLKSLLPVEELLKVGNVGGSVTNLVIHYKGFIYLIIILLHGMAD